MSLTATKPTVLCFVNENQEPVETPSIYFVAGGKTEQPARIGDFLIVSGELYWISGIIDTTSELRLNLIRYRGPQVFRIYTSWEAKP